MSKGLGKGINALFPPDETPDNDSIQQIKIKDLRPNPYQPRKTFDEAALRDLQSSIEEHGIIQPLIVRKSIKGYDIVAGERRYRAAIEAKLKTVPVIVKPLTDKEMMEIAVIENLQREDLNPIEEAAAYQKLMNELDITQDVLAKKLGKSRPYISNHLRLLQLNSKIQTLIAEGKLSMGHGRTLLGLKDKTKYQAVADKIIKEQMNVRELEELIQKLNQNVPRETSKKRGEVKLSPELKQKVNFLKERLGTAVLIKQTRSKNKGKIEIDYYSSDDLARIMELLEGQEKE